MERQQGGITDPPIDEVRAIIERNLFPIYVGMICAEFFSRERETGPANDYLRLKELLQIGRGFDPSALASVRDFQKKSPDSYRRIIRELECQVGINVLRRRYRLYDAVLNAAVLMLHASPLARADRDASDVRRFIETIERGHIGFE